MGEKWDTLAGTSLLNDVRTARILSVNHWIAIIRIPTPIFYIPFADEIHFCIEVLNLVDTREYAGHCVEVSSSWEDENLVERVYIASSSWQHASWANVSVFLSRAYDCRRSWVITCKLPQVDLGLCRRWIRLNESGVVTCITSILWLFFYNDCSSIPTVSVLLKDLEGTSEYRIRGSICSTQYTRGFRRGTPESRLASKSCSLSVFTYWQYSSTTHIRVATYSFTPVQSR